MNIDLSVALNQVQTMLNGFVKQIPSIIIGIIVFFIFFFIGKGVRALIRKFSDRNQKHRNVGLVMGRLAHGFIVLLGLMIALVIIIPGFDPGQLVQLLGISGVAIGFAFRDILQNFLAGILILLTQPFNIGDQIITGDYEGTVEDIQTRATTIRTYDGRRVVIPNANLFTSAVMVNTAFEHRRLQYDVGIGYGDDIQKARELMLEVVKKQDGVLEDPAPDCIIVDLADSTVNLRIRYWVQPPRQADVLAQQDVVLTAIKQTLSENGIDLPFPTQQILFHDQTEETDGDRPAQREGWPAKKADNPRPLWVVKQQAREEKAEVEA